MNDSLSETARSISSVSDECSSLSDYLSDSESDSELTNINKRAEYAQATENNPARSKLYEWRNYTHTWTRWNSESNSQRSLDGPSTSTGLERTERSENIVDAVQHDTPHQEPAICYPTTNEMHKYLVSTNKGLRGLRKVSRGNHTKLDKQTKWMKVIRRGQKHAGNKLNEIRDLLYLANKKIDDKFASAVDHMETVQEHSRLIRSLTLDNIYLKKKLNILKYEVDDLNKSEKRNSVEMYGIPEFPDEDVMDIVRRVGFAIGVDIPVDAVDCCYRTQKFSQQEPAGILVTFVTAADKEKVVKIRRTKGKLIASDIGFPSDNPVYVGKCLTPLKRGILAEVIKLKEERNYASVWVDRSGNIKVQQQENDSNIYSLKALKDLRKLNIITL